MTTDHEIIGAIPVLQGREEVKPTTDLATWLTATLDAVQARAEAAEAIAESPWSVEESSWGEELGGVVAASPLKLPGWRRPPTELWSGEGSDAVYGSKEVAAHVAYWDPTTVLRMVAASRKVLEWHKPTDYNAGLCSYCIDGLHEEPLSFPCEAVTEEAARWGWTGLYA